MKKTGANEERPIMRFEWEIRPRDAQPVLRGDLRVRESSQPRSAVVICHGFKGFKDWGFFPALASAVAERGHAALTFNFGHSGVGADGVDFSALHLFAENTHSQNVAEIHAVLDALREGSLLKHPPERIGIVGHSRGGGEAVLAAGAGAPVDALVTWSAIASVQRWSEAQVSAWRRGETVHIPNARTGQQMPMGPGYWRDIEANRERLDIAAAAARVRVPWLIVHGVADESVSVADAHALREASGERAELLLVEDAGHTFGATHPMDGVTPQVRIAIDATVRWLDEYLGKASEPARER